MQRPWVRPFREALREALASVGKLAEGAGYSRVTFDTYLNRREPSRRAALALADLLELQGKRLTEQAQRVREAAGEAPRGGSA